MLRISTTRATLAALTLGVAAFAGAAAAQPTHELLLTNGETIKVEIVEEGDAELEVKVYYGSLSAPRTFQRNEIITITELGDTAGGDDPAAEVEDARASDDRPADAIPVYTF